VAHFTFEGSLFSLVPGGPVTIGYDAGRPWEPTPDELASWESTIAEYGFPEEIREHLEAATLRPREVVLGPFLAEAVAGEVGWELASLEDPEVRKYARSLRGRVVENVVHGVDSTVLRVRRRPDRSIEAHRSWGATHADLAGRLAASGFRFPTSDEWEFLCGAGSPTLFRWGDHAPCLGYPPLVPQSELERLSAPVSSGSPPDDPTEQNPNHRPSAFGAIIAADSYRFELVAEPGVSRGGDGGSIACGGAGFFLGWLNLATAYFEEHSCRHDPAEPIHVGYTVGRRVLPLG
jgi:hypothetical protein